MNIVHSYSDPHSQDLAPLKANGNQSSASLPARIDSLAVDAEEKNLTSHTPMSSPPGPVASFQPIVTASDSTPSSSPTPPCTIPAQPDDTVSPPLQLSTSPSALAASPPPVLNHGSTSPPPPTTTQEFSPSSIDEEVPVVDLSSTLPPTSSISVPTNNEAKPSVLNATPSRFAIAIPFLGRTKVPLGNVLKKDEQDNKVEGLPATQIPEVKDIGQFFLTSPFQIILFSIRYIVTPTYYDRTIRRCRSRFIAKCHGSSIRVTFHNRGRNGAIPRHPS